MAQLMLHSPCIQLVDKTCEFALNPEVSNFSTVVSQTAFFVLKLKKNVTVRTTV